MHALQLTCPSAGLRDVSGWWHKTSPVATMARWMVGANLGLRVTIPAGVIISAAAAREAASEAARSNGSGAGKPVSTCSRQRQPLTAFTETNAHAGSAHRGIASRL